MAGESRLTTEQKRDKLLGLHAQAAPPAEVVKPPVTKPPIDLSRLRPTVRREVEAGVTRQSHEATKAAAIFVRTGDSFLKASPRIEDQMIAADSELYRLHKRSQGNPEEVFKDCRVQYGYNQRQNIYSISTMLEGRPRIITVQVGNNFTQLSLADKTNNSILEVLHQQDGKGVTFSKTG